MVSLFAAGWAQGVLVRHQLQYATTQLVDGQLSNAILTHGLWVLADQDCDLSETDIADNIRHFELRAVEPMRENIPSGIRSRQMKLTDNLIVHADAPRVRLSAAALHALRVGLDADAVSETQRREIKTWFGLRYDRPAVPDRFVAASRKLRKLLDDKHMRPQPGLVRDILVFFGDNPGATFVHLWAVLKTGADPTPVRRWLESVGSALDAAQQADPVVVVGEIEVADTENTSLAIVESYFAISADKLSRSADGGG